MKQFKLSIRLVIISIIIITVIFLAIISPLQGLSILTWPLILLGIALWIVSLIILISGLFDKQRENGQKKAMVIALLLIIGFIPIGIIYMKLSGDIRTKITVNIINQSDSIPDNILIYGAGTIFENSDTLKVNKFNKGEKIEYVTRPITKPYRNGYIRLEFDINGKHIEKNIAGEFSINPYNIQQEWEITIDNAFFK